MADGVVLKEFGRRESEARQALRLGGGLRLTQHGTVGEPPVMEYWLKRRSRPHRVCAGHPAPAGRLRQPQGRAARKPVGCARPSARLVQLQRRGDQAEQALTVMQKYRFTQAAVLGNPLAPNMMVFTANPCADRDRGGGAQVRAFPACGRDRGSGGVRAGHPAAARPRRHAAQSAGDFVQPGADRKSPREADGLSPGRAPRHSGTDRVASHSTGGRRRCGRNTATGSLEAGSHVLGDFGGTSTPPRRR